MKLVRVQTEGFKASETVGHVSWEDPPYLLPGAQVSYKGGTLLHILEPELHLRTDDERTQCGMPLERLVAHGTLMEKELEALVAADKAPKPFPTYRLGLPIKHDQLRLSIETKKVTTSKRDRTSIFSCAICPSTVGIRKESTMLRNDLRAHVAGHVVVGHGPPNPCGFCGRFHCTIAIEDGKIQTYCELKVHFPTYRKLNSDRDDEVRRRTDLIKAGCERSFDIVWLTQEGKHWPVANIPIACPSCAKVVWKYNMVTHFLDKHLEDEPEQNYPGWRAKSVKLKKALKTYAILLKGPMDTVKKQQHMPELDDDNKAKIQEVVKEVNQLLPSLLGMKWSFILEEIARERHAAVKSLYGKMGLFVEKPKVRKAANIGGEAVAAGGGEENEEDEEEEEGVN